METKNCCGAVGKVVRGFKNHHTVRCQLPPEHEGMHQSSDGARTTYFPRGETQAGGDTRWRWGLHPTWLTEDRQK